MVKKGDFKDILIGSFIALMIILFLIIIPNFLGDLEYIQMGDEEEFGLQNLRFNLQNFLFLDVIVLGGEYNSDPLSLANGQSILFVDQSNYNCSDSYTREQALDPETPWCNPKALHENNPRDKLQPGDTIYIREGDYVSFLDNPNSQLTIKTSGTENERITISSYPGENVIIRGGLWTVLVFDGTDYLTLKDINFVGYRELEEGRLYTKYIVYFQDSSSIEVINSTFMDFQGLDNIDDHGAYYGTGLRLENVTNVHVDGIKARCTESPSLAAPMQFGGDGLLCDYCENVIIENSEFYDCGHDGLHSRWSKDMIIQNNIFRNRFHNCIGIGAGQNHTVRNNIIYGWNQWNLSYKGTGTGAGIELLDASNNKIYNNIIYNGSLKSDAIHIVTYYGRDWCPNSDNNEIYNNLIYVSGRSAILMVSTGNEDRSNRTINNNKVYNNIIYDLNEERTGDRGLIYLWFYDFSGEDGYGNEFKNNIIKRTDEGPDITLFTRSLGERTNFTLSEFEEDFSFASGNINDNPLFVDLENRDFHLSLESPAIDAGRCIDYITEDFDGVARPSQQGCDIGPYEYLPEPLPLEEYIESSSGGNNRRRGIILNISNLSNNTVIDENETPDEDTPRQVKGLWEKVKGTLKNNLMIVLIVLGVCLIIILFFIILVLRKRKANKIHPLDRTFKIKIKRLLRLRKSIIKQHKKIVKKKKKDDPAHEERDALAEDIRIFKRGASKLKEIKRLIKKD